jgi:hypothetical protein
VRKRPLVFSSVIPWCKKELGHDAGIVMFRLTSKKANDPGGSAHKPRRHVNPWTVERPGLGQCGDELPSGVIAGRGQSLGQTPGKQALDDTSGSALTERLCGETPFDRWVSRN